MKRRKLSNSYAKKHFKKHSGYSRINKRPIARGGIQL